MSAICETSKPLYSPIFSNIKNYRDIAQAIQEGAAKDYYSFLDALAKKNCSKRQKIQIEIKRIGTRPESFGEAMQALRAGNSPIFTINSKLLFKEGFNFNLGPAAYGNHAVNLVGSRIQNGKCFLKIRDSTYGGDNCRSVQNRGGIICPPPGKSDGTFEIAIEQFLRAARYGLVIK